MDIRWWSVTSARLICSPTRAAARLFAPSPALRSHHLHIYSARDQCKISLLGWASSVLFSFFLFFSQWHVVRNKSWHTKDNSLWVRSNFCNCCQCEVRQNIETKEASVEYFCFFFVFFPFPWSLWVNLYLWYLMGHLSITIHPAESQFPLDLHWHIYIHEITWMKIHEILPLFTKCGRF